MRMDDGTPGDPTSPPDDDLETWSNERHRELELLVARDREVELARRREADQAAQAARREHAARLEHERRRREAELPAELRDVDDEPWDGGPRRRLVMGSSRVLAAVALLAAVAVAVTGFL
jgi:hypothetical protein